MKLIYKTTIGSIQITSERDAVTSISYERDSEYGNASHTDSVVWAGSGSNAEEVCRRIEDFESYRTAETAMRQICEYLAGNRKEFTFPIQTKGTVFQEKVWAALREIPYGETRSYGQIAVWIGNPKAVRAVGMANHRNPIMIATPCHRVIGADGSLTGYACGTDLKKYLLNLEKDHKNV